MPKPLSPVIQRLKEWRARNNLSQAQALIVFQEGSLPVTLDALQNRESGRNSRSPLAAAALADFGAPPDGHASTRPKEKMPAIRDHVIAYL